MKKASSVILDPVLQFNILRELKKRYIDAYLLVCIVLEIGCQHSPLMRMSVKELRDYLKGRNISNELMTEINIHIRDKKDTDYFTASKRNYNRPMSKRTAEDSLLECGEHNGVEDLGIRTFYHAHFFNKYISYDYDYTLMREYILKFGKFYVKTLNDFLKYICVDPDEFKEYYQAQRANNKGLVLDEMDSVICTISDIRDKYNSDWNMDNEKKCKLIIDLYDDLFPRIG